MCYNISTKGEKIKTLPKIKNRVATNARKRYKMAEVKEMTMREFFETIVNGEVTDKVIEKAKAEITKLDTRNAKRKGDNSKRAKENEPIKAEILSYLAENEGVHTSAQIGLAIGQSTAKVSSLCGQLAKADKVKVTEVKEKGKAKVNGYALA